MPFNDFYRPKASTYTLQLSYLHQVLILKLRVTWINLASLDFSLS